MRVEPQPSPERSSPINQLREIVARLRTPDGCPWDRAQTHATLRAGLVEEAYEVVEAIISADGDDLREELGDLLLQVVMHAQIASEDGRFDFDAVARVICEKLVRRHPHVFGGEKCTDSSEVLRRWDDIKRAEKGGAADSILNGVSKGIPALMRAEKVQKKAARVGFDWSDAEPVIAKVREELLEIESAIEEQNAAGIEDEVGDLLFSAVNLARKLKVDAETALTRATDKFVTRFHRLEQVARERGLELGKMTLAELDAIWDDVKRTG